MLPWWVGAFGLVYLASAVVLGGLLMGGVVKMLLAARRGAPWSGPAWWVYKYSLLYLALLFVAMAVDRIAGAVSSTPGTGRKRPHLTAAPRPPAASPRAVSRAPAGARSSAS